MKILCDQCINRDVILALRDVGFDVVHTSEIRLSRASDETIFHHSRRLRRVLLTFDHDFGNITRFSIRNCPGVVVIYTANMTKEMIIERALHTFKYLFKNRYPSGQLFIVESDSIRIWPK